MSSNQKNQKLPIIPLREIMIIPTAIVPVILGREKSINALNKAAVEGHLVLTVLQKDPSLENNPKAKDLHRSGTLCKIVQIFNLPDGNSRVILEGLELIDIDRFFANKNYLSASFLLTEFDYLYPQNSSEHLAYIRILKKVFIEYIKLEDSTPKELELSLQKIEDHEDLFYFILSNNKRKPGEIRAF
ncbi:MAG: LON peptidase substrate-binding domain-containing protein [Candidatus Cloacimonadota bacterium]|nr:LON peptidase substrate-binding domain-containing protein [Candidatus Cloacimonadota bacterium]